MDSPSWSDLFRAAWGSCLPCIRAPSSSDVPRTRNDELEGLLVDAVDTDTEAETLSLHSNPGGRRTRQPKKTSKRMTIFGYSLFGRPAIQLPPDEDAEETARVPPRRRDRRGNSTAAATISSFNLDSDAAPLDPSAIDGLSTSELEQRAIAAAEEERRQREERRRRRTERKALKKVARALAVGGTEGDEFEGFQGSGGGVYPTIPPPFQPSPSVTDSQAELSADDADLDGEHYVRNNSASGTQNGSDSRSRTSHSPSQRSKDAVNRQPSPHPRLSPLQHSTSHPPRRTKKSRSSVSTSQTASLSSPILSPIHDPVIVSSPTHHPDGVIENTNDGFPIARFGDISAGFGSRAKSRDLGAFLARRDV